MKVICAWCDKVLQEGSGDLLASHGICSECFDRQMREEGLPNIEGRLDALNRREDYNDKPGH